MMEKQEKFLLETDPCNRVYFLGSPKVRSMLLDSTTVRVMDRVNPVLSLERIYPNIREDGDDRG